MFFRTFVVWAAGLPITIFLFLVVLLSIPVYRGGGAVHAIGAFWCRIILALAGVRVRVDGVENIPASEPVIFLSNHQGAFDIPALQGYIPVTFRWVAKRSLFKIPIVGWSMSLAGYISMEREKGRSAYRSLERAAASITTGTPVLVFPEGTRSPTDELMPFKRGAFLLVRKSGVPVVPVAIEGSRDIMKRGSLAIRPAEISIRFGKPIETRGVKEAELMERTRQAIEALRTI